MFLNLEKKLQEIKTTSFRNLGTKLKPTPWDFFKIKNIYVF
jgi:hypothetical protein